MGGSQTSGFDVNVVNVDNLKDDKNITLTATDVKLDGAALPDADALTISFKEGENVLTNGVDTTMEAKNTYTVEVSLDADKVADASLYAGKALSFTIKAEATNKVV